MAARDLPPLNWLRAFESAARTLSFTEAAAELNVTQAAISKQIKALEAGLQHPLFLRRARSLELTTSGEAYLPKVQDALERLAIGTHEVFGRRRTEALTVRCAVSFAVNWLAPRLPDYIRQHPDLPLRILSSVWSDPFDPTAYDLDIQYGKGAWPGLTSHRLTWEKITPLCAPETARRLHNPSDLRHQQLLHVLGYQEGWGIWLQAAGAKALDPGQGLQLDTSLTAFALAAQGTGIALGRSSLAAQDRAAGRLVAPFELEVPVDEAFHLLAPQGQPLHPDAGVFQDWIKGICGG
jgi:LysR family transcriptional regulator, glycine cleavage system transcriptional activator